MLLGGRGTFHSSWAREVFAPGPGDHVSLGSLLLAAGRRGEVGACVRGVRHHNAHPVRDASPTETLLRPRTRTVVPKGRVPAPQTRDPVLPLLDPRLQLRCRRSSGAATALWALATTQGLGVSPGPSGPSTLLLATAQPRGDPGREGVRADVTGASLSRVSWPLLPAAAMLGALRGSATCCRSWQSRTRPGPSGAERLAPRRGVGPGGRVGRPRWPGRGPPEVLCAVLLRATL